MLPRYAVTTRRDLSRRLDAIRAAARGATMICRDATNMRVMRARSAYVAQRLRLP